MGAKSGWNGKLNKKFGSEVFEHDKEYNNKKAVTKSDREVKKLWEWGQRERGEDYSRNNYMLYFFLFLICCNVYTLYLNFQIDLWKTNIFKLFKYHFTVLY